MKTLRLLLFWECNLTCSYCCNEIPEVREGILPIKKKRLILPNMIMFVYLGVNHFYNLN